MIEPVTRARRNGDAGRLGEGLVAGKPGRLGRAERGRGGRSAGRRRDGGGRGAGGTAARRIDGLFDLLLLALAFGLGAGDEILPTHEHRDRKRDRDEEVLIVHHVTDLSPASSFRASALNPPLRSWIESIEWKGQGGEAADNDDPSVPGDATPAAASLTASLRRRLIRLRMTAFPIFLVTVKPKRGGRAPSFDESACSTKPGRESADPARPHENRCDASAVPSAPAVAGRRSGGKPLATPGATGSDYLAAAGSRHSRTRIHAGACGQACSVDRSVSYLKSLRAAGSRGASGVARNQVNAAPQSRRWWPASHRAAAVRSTIPALVVRQDQMPEELAPDICVIGGGPGGIALAVAAANRNVPVVLIEKDRLGGASLRIGSIPTKAFIAAANQYETLRRGPAVGVTGRPSRSILPRSTSMCTRSAMRSPNVSAERLSALGVTVVKGEGRFVDRRTVVAGEATIGARRFVIATGASPAPPAPSGARHDRCAHARGAVRHAPEAKPSYRSRRRAARPRLAQAYNRLGVDATVIDTEKALTAPIPNWSPSSSTVSGPKASVSATASRSPALRNGAAPFG